MYKEKWRETIDPFSLPFKHFELKEVLGYPAAGNDVFFVKGIANGVECEAFIKSARQKGADIEREVSVINKLKPIMPSVIPDVLDFGKNFSVTAKMNGERLSVIAGANESLQSMEYLPDYGRTLAKLHCIKGDFEPVKDRKFFHIPSAEFFHELNNGELSYVRDYLVENAPKKQHSCFCHGDFHYANVLFHDGRLSAILDFELSGIGNCEFDIAWAIILRPGQRFMKTEKEVRCFLDNYAALLDYDENAVFFYMVLIYSYFYKIGRNDAEYAQFVENFFRRQIK